jgi:predicted nucleotidyltransferase
MFEASPQRALRDIVGWLESRRLPFALVGGLAVSVRGEVRFTRDVDLVLSVGETDLDRIVRDLRAARYEIHALFEHEVARRTSLVRLVTREAIHVDLLVASSGIEPEIVADATIVEIPGVGGVPVATAEDLLATKVLAMGPRRRQDLDDAIRLVLSNPDLDLERVRARLALISARGFDRGQVLSGKLQQVLAEAEADRDG